MQSAVFFVGCYWLQLIGWLWVIRSINDYSNDRSQKKWSACAPADYTKTLTFALAAGAIVRNKIKASHRPRRKLPLKWIRAIGRGDCTKWNQSKPSAGAIAPPGITLPLRPGRKLPLKKISLCGRDTTLTETPTITVRWLKNPDRIRVAEKRKFNRKNIFIPGRKYFHFPMYQTKKCL